MKVVRIPVFVLLLILVLSLCNSIHLSRRCADWITQLDTADAAAQQQSWQDTRQALENGYNSWRSSQTWLHIVIEHEEIDAAESLWQRACVLSREEDSVEFRSVLSELHAQLMLLDEMERVSIKNIL